MSGEIGYLTLAEANTYFTTRLSSSAWTGSDATKTAALTTAYDRLFYSGLFDLPTLAEATAEQLVILKKAQCEMAYYLLLHLADEDRRKGLQAQGIIEAGIVKERYSEKDLADLPIPAFVSGLLDDYSTAAADFYVSAVDRDEDEEDMEL